MKINGIIEEKKLGKSGEGPYGPWQCYVFTMNGNRYSSFKKEHYDAVKVGDAVEVEGEQTDKGFNMKEIKLLDVKPEVVKPEVAMRTSVSADIDGLPLQLLQEGH